MSAISVRVVGCGHSWGLVLGRCDEGWGVSRSPDSQLIVFSGKSTALLLLGICAAAACRSASGRELLSDAVDAQEGGGVGCATVV